MAMGCGWLFSGFPESNQCPLSLRQLSGHHRIPWTAWLKQQTWIPRSSEGHMFQTRVWQGWFRRDPSPWLADGHLLAVS